MSREVIDEGLAAADWSGTDPRSAASWVVEDVVQGVGDDVAPSGLGPPPDSPPPDSPPSDGSPPDRPSGGGARRDLAVPWTTGLVMLALVLGALVGGWQAQRGVDIAAQAGNRLLVWVDDVSQHRNQAAPQVPTADFVAVARSTGGAVLVHQVTTPFGSVSFGPDVPVDARSAHPLHIAMAPDCSGFVQWGDDWTKAPRTGTALVRDQLGAPLHEVPVDLVGDLVLSDLIDTCRLLYPDPVVTATDTAATPALIFTSVSGAPDGTLALRVLAPTPSRPHVLLDLTVLDQVAGHGPGQFALSARPPLPVSIKPGDDVHVTVTLTYQCGLGGAQLPVSQDSVLVMRVADADTGELVDTVGWSQADIADAVRGAMATAGCPAASG